MNDNVTLNIEAIRQQARKDWFKQRTKQRSLRELIEASVPNWLIIVALALFFLSAPHTAKMFDMITPGFGWAGVLLCEFGLMYVAFRRRIEKKRSGNVPAFLTGFEVLVFTTSILVNGAGALIAVVTFAKVDTKSAEAILSGIRDMPIVSQVGLLLVPLAAIIIPIGTKVAGEGLATHSIDGRDEDSALEQQWREVEQLEVYHAVFSYLVSRNENARDAKRRAASATTNFFNTPTSDPRPEINHGDIKPIPEPGMQSAFVMPSTRTNPRTRSRTRIIRRRADVRLAVQEHLQAHPEDAQKSSGEIAKLVGVSKTVAWEELTKWRDQHNP
jgi:hypothetical protein